MNAQQEQAVDRLSLAGGGFASVFAKYRHGSAPMEERLVELIAVIPPKARRFTVNEDGSALDHETGELHRYVREKHEFVPPVPSAFRTRVRP